MDLRHNLFSPSLRKSVNYRHHVPPIMAVCARLTGTKQYARILRKYSAALEKRSERENMTEEELSMACSSAQTQTETRTPNYCNING